VRGHTSGPARTWILAALAAGLVACGGAAQAGNGGGIAGAGGAGGSGGIAGNGGTGGSGGVGGSGGTGGTGGLAAVCGDGVRETGEACDDGNRAPRDGCDASCRYECLADADCDLARGQVCRPFDEYQPVYGECVAGVFCAVDPNCHALDIERCPSTESCVCVPSDAATSENLAGVCRQRTGVCAPCGTDAECGDGAYFDRPAACVSLAVGGGGTQTVCLPRYLPSRTCPPGFQTGPDGEFCVPVSGRCQEPECRIDADCGGGERCSVAAGVCVPAECHLDPATGATVGCGGERSACHVTEIDTERLAACEWSRRWGWGSCGPPCAGDADCAGRIDPRDGSAFVCRHEGGADRCRPAGCLADADCVAPDGDYRGYCEATTSACVFDACRLEAPPRRCGVAPDDCRNDTYCYPDASLPEGVGRCLPPRP
jgi:cysteine-rich repeat protein